MERRIDHMLDTGGRSLSEADRQFVTLLFRELEQFQYQAPKDRALMFHPLRGYERYLIHKVTEIFPKLTSFSIGDEKTRRTVVCFKSKRKEQQMQLGQVSSPERRPISRTSTKDPRGSTVPRGLGRNKSAENSPARGRRRGSDPGSKNKMGKYNTWDGEALKKRERGLTLEGQVMNGEIDAPRHDAEIAYREPRENHDSKKHPRHRAKRSRSQPQLMDRARPRHRRDSLDESTDQQFSDIDNITRKSKRPVSENNTPEKHRNKSIESESVHMDRIEAEVMRHRPDIHSSSEGSTKISAFDHSDIDNNDIPPSYEGTSESSVKSKAKRNLRRIKRSNSTKSCPPLDRSKRDYVNGEMVPKKAEKPETNHNESPVFSRRGKSNLSDAESKISDTKSRTNSEKRNRTSRRKNKEERKPSREYVNIPNEEFMRPTSYESSAFDSFSPETPDAVSTTNGYIDPVDVVENTIPDDIHDGAPRLVTSAHNLESMSNHFDGVEAPPPPPLSTAIPLATALFKPAAETTEKDTQTDLHGHVIDAMMTTYNAQMDALGQLAPLHPLAPQPGSTIPPSSLRTSGTSTPSLSSPASSYEKLGEYMYKAMLNFQNMLLGGMPQQPNSGPSPYPTPAPMYAAPIAPSAQPLYVPWMTTYFADPNSRPSTVPYSLPPHTSHTSGDACCVHHQPPTLNKMPPHSHGSLKDLGKDILRSTPPRDEPHRWHGSHRYNSDRTPSSAEHSMSAHPSRSSKPPDGFESDVSSEITNPEITVAEGGEGVMVYVRNSTRSSSTGGASFAGSANSLPGPAGDNIARASPLGHDNDSVFNKKASSSSISDESKNSSRSKGRVTPKGTPKKTHKKKRSDIKPHTDADLELVNGPGIVAEEVTLPLGNAPLARMEDGDDSGSFTSSHSSHRDKTSDPLVTESAKLLIGEDLGPVVCFDDNLETACQDGSAED